MGIELPQELVGVAAKAGVRWPEADEDAMKQAARAWRDAGAAISTLAGNADSAARGALSAAQGEAANAAGRHWNGFVRPDFGHLTVAARGCTDAADRLDHAADQVGAAKVEIVRNLVSLARNADAAEQAAAAGYPEALTALDTAVSGTAANVATIHSGLVDSVRPAAANLAGAVDVGPGSGALAGTVAQVTGDGAQAVGNVVDHGRQVPDHVTQGVRPGPGGAAPGPVLGDTAATVGQVAAEGAQAVAGAVDHGQHVVEHGVPGFPGEVGPGQPDPERTGPLPIGGTAPGGHLLPGDGPGGHPQPGGPGGHPIPGAEPGFGGGHGDRFPGFSDAPTPPSGVPLGGIVPPHATHTVVSSAAGLLDVPSPGQSVPSGSAGPAPGAAGVVHNPVAGNPIAGGPIAGGPIAGGPIAGGPVPVAPVASGPVAGGPVAGAVPPAGQQPAGQATNLPPQRVPDRAAPVLFTPDQHRAANPDRIREPERRIDAPVTSAPPAQAVPVQAVPVQRTEREKFVALFLMRMFPIGHLPVASNKPMRQLPPPAEAFDYAAGIRFPPHDHPRSDLLDGTDALRAVLAGRAPVEVTPGRPADDPVVAALAAEHDPLGGVHERDWDRRFLVRARGEDGNAEYAWPPAEVYPEGGTAPGEPELLLEGAVIDRFGGPEGRVFADGDTAFGARSLPPAHLESGYRRYRVLRPLPAWRAMSAAWFAQPGGGIRWRTVYSATDLVALGYLAEITEVDEAQPAHEPQAEVSPAESTHDTGSTAATASTKDTVSTRDTEATTGERV